MLTAVAIAWSVPTHSSTACAPNPRHIANPGDAFLAALADDVGRAKNGRAEPRHDTRLCDGIPDATEVNAWINAGATGP